MMRLNSCRVYLFVWVLSVVCSSSCKEKRGELRPIVYNGSYNRDFNDLNELHLASAQQAGIKPVASRKEAEKASKKMVEIRSCNAYEVEELTHSIPFLVPEAAQLLQTIGQSFQDSLDQLNAPLYRIKVTSLTRTVEDIKTLRRRNTNSSENSAHQYGTTVDISWVRYTKIDPDETTDLGNDRLKMVLASVLRAQRKANSCYIKHERKQGCFHITVRNE